MFDACNGCRGRWSPRCWCWFPSLLSDRSFCGPHNTYASGNEARNYCNCRELNTYLSDRNHSFYWLTITIHFVTQLHVRKEVDNSKSHWNFMADYANTNTLFATQNSLKVCKARVCKGNMQLLVSRHSAHAKLTSLEAGDSEWHVMPSTLRLHVPRTNCGNSSTRYITDFPCEPERSHRAHRVRGFVISNCFLPHPQLLPCPGVKTRPQISQVFSGTHCLLSALMTCWI